MQVKSLEDALCEPLFELRGRRLELTEIGRVAHGYAEEIFRTGRELLDAVRPVGELESVAERFYAISPERRIRHPATALIARQAKESLFG